MKILVTGAGGQLGQTFKAISELPETGDLQFAFREARELDITDPEAVHREFSEGQYAYCINCAAFTHVDRAEDKRKEAHNINVNGVRYLAQACKENHAVLIHISTDFVFDGFLNTPYKESDLARPIGFYGDTKYKGERAVVQNLEEYFIVRTSWLYSEFGSNFMKTMIRLGQEKPRLSVVYDQVGTPTYAYDLAAAIVHIIQAHSIEYGIYHYSNEGVASWYDFARAIFNDYGIETDLSPILSEEYPTAAERPKYSVMDKNKIKKTFGLDIPHWRDSLRVALQAHANMPDL